MGDEMHNSFRKAEHPFYHDQEEWQSYGQTDHNYRNDPNFARPEQGYTPEQSYGGEQQYAAQERGNYVQYDQTYGSYPVDQANYQASVPDHVNYNSPGMKDQGAYAAPAGDFFNYGNSHGDQYNYQNQVNGRYDYVSPVSDQMSYAPSVNQQVGYSNQAGGERMGSAGYYQPRGYVVQNYAKQEQHYSPNMGASVSSMGGNMHQQVPPVNYYQNYPYYNGQQPRSDLPYDRSEVMMHKSEYGADRQGMVMNRHDAAMGREAGNEASNSRQDLQMARPDMGVPRGDMRVNRGEMAAGRPDVPENYQERALFGGNQVFKPSISFKEVANAMLSLESGRPMQQPRRPSNRGRGGMKNVSRPRGPYQDSDLQYADEAAYQEGAARYGEKGMRYGDKGSKQGDRSRRSAEDEAGMRQDGVNYKSGGSQGGSATGNAGSSVGHTSGTGSTGRVHSTIRTDPEYSKYRNRGLQQLTQYSAQHALRNFSNYIVGSHPSSSASSAAGASVSNNNMANKTKGDQEGGYNSMMMNSMMMINNVIRRDLVPIKKLNPNVLTPSARFFPPTPKALSNIRNDQMAHKMNVVEEINVENELIKNLKRNSISSASALMESFQQSFSNKKKRIKNCLVEDCRHVIGEQPKIDVQYSSVEINGEKKYLLNEILSTLLPYHLFYYESVGKQEVEPFDYSNLGEQIRELSHRLNQMTRSGEAILLQSVYPCVKEGLVTCNELVFNLRHDPSAYQHH